MSLLKVENLTKKYGDFTALKGVSFEIEKGSTLYVYGKNGAGKTTLLEIICGIQKATHGNVSLFESDLSSQPESIYSKMGVVFTDSFLYGDLSVEENLRFYCKLNELENRDHRIDSMLAKFDLMDKRDSLVKHLSSGLEKRTALARAFLADPELLVMDEPTLGLDSDSKSQVISFLKDFTSKGGSLVFASHDTVFAGKLSSRLIYLKNGSLEFTGSFEQARDKEGLEL